MDNRRGFLIFGGTFAGAIFLTLGLVLGYQTCTFLATASRAEGEVIALERRRSHPRGNRRLTEYHYYPVVKYMAADGQTVQFVGQVGSKPPAFRVGQRVKVLYNPEQPRSARINSFFELWLAPMIFTGLGGIFLLMGGVALVNQFRPR